MDTVYLQICKLGYSSSAAQGAGGSSEIENL